MKIRVCDQCQSRVIRELDECQAPLLTRYKEKGRVYMEIRDSVEQKEPSHKWSYVAREIVSRPDAKNPRAEEDIICYIVKEMRHEDLDDDTGGWNTPSSNLTTYDENPEFRRGRK